MELISVKKEPTIIISRSGLKVKSTNDKDFIKANSIAIDLDNLSRDCIVPVFAKDNEVTISHSQFIEVGLDALKIALGVDFNTPQVRVSHQIKGRTPDALYLDVKDLKEEQKTTYYERMAWVARIPQFTTCIDGNEVSLAIGGIRAYNQENLYSKKSFEKFKFFIGFQNMVCLNLCISSDGTVLELKSDSLLDLRNKLVGNINKFDYKKQYSALENLTNCVISDKQFSTIIGKARLYQYLPKKDKVGIPELLITDSQFGIVAKDYYKDQSFCRNTNGDINLWKLYNLLTGANKSSYIDKFLERGINAYEFTQGISLALREESEYSWFLD